MLRHKKDVAYYVFYATFTKSYNSNIFIKVMLDEYHQSSRTPMKEFENWSNNCNCSQRLHDANIKSLIADLETAWVE